MKQCAMLEDIRHRETRRLTLQASVDAQKSSQQRNKLGQYATPPTLANAILQYARHLLPAGQRLRFLDPALGSGAFYAALRVAFDGRIDAATGFEVDPAYADCANSVWGPTGLTTRCEDFTRAAPQPHFNLVVCNPPYVRHHHLAPAEKRRLQLACKRHVCVTLSGLTGLYCHFMALAHRWMAPGALAAWLVPSEFMDVNYGAGLKAYLLDQVTLLHIHRFDPHDVQFADALVSSAIVWFRNEAPPVQHAVTFSFGGSLEAPKQARAVPHQTLRTEAKWTRFPQGSDRIACLTPTLSHYFTIKRGVATGNNRYFIVREAELAERSLPRDAFCPILPSPRHLHHDHIDADAQGVPCVQPRLFLLNTRLSEADVRARSPALWRYLQHGRALGVHRGYLCRHRPVWFHQESRPPAPLLCTYLGRPGGKRSRPFRFFLNASQATVANTYLAMYPKAQLAAALAADATLMQRLWQALNDITTATLLAEARVYGGGLHKLEPKELGRVLAGDICDLVGF